MLGGGTRALYNPADNIEMLDYIIKNSACSTILVTSFSIPSVKFLFKTHNSILSKHSTT